jgi:hypothetical protein
MSLQTLDGLLLGANPIGDELSMFKYWFVRIPATFTVVASCPVLRSAHVCRCIPTDQQPGTIPPLTFSKVEGEAVYICCLRYQSNHSWQ